jgi:hypothetical protein
MVTTDGRTRHQEPQHAPWDQALSTKLDVIQQALDDRPTSIRRTVLRIRKAWYERNVPAYHGEVAR